MSIARCAVEKGKGRPVVDAFRREGGRLRFVFENALLQRRFGGEESGHAARKSFQCTFELSDLSGAFWVPGHLLGHWSNSAVLGCHAHVSSPRDVFLVVKSQTAFWWSKDGNRAQTSFRCLGLCRLYVVVWCGDFWGKANSQADPLSTHLRSSRTSK